MSTGAHPRCPIYRYYLDNKTSTARCTLPMGHDGAHVDEGGGDPRAWEVIDGRSVSVQRIAATVVRDYRKPFDGVVGWPITMRAPYEPPAIERTEPLTVAGLATVAGAPPGVVLLATALDVLLDPSGRALSALLIAAAAGHPAKAPSRPRSASERRAARRQAKRRGRGASGV